jgi:CDP-glucose 4,6-dehydratase
MAPFLKSFSGKRVLVTGHTGFKGSWLSEWLLGMDAEVWGFSLAPATKPALFNQLGLERRLTHIVGDVRDPACIQKAVTRARPDFVFHLAAQPLVHAAHAHPSDTWSTNVMGTVHLLEALRRGARPCVAVIVTTDKVYGEGLLAHTERSPLLARDPYGSSKTAVELAVAAWRETFFTLSRVRGGAFPIVALATARAGNVIGGGDWAKDRLIPDCIRAFSRDRDVVVRNPSAVRPWQHVLDPLAGYLTLAAEMQEALVLRDRKRFTELTGAFNFGPAAGDHRRVDDVVQAAISCWPGTRMRATKHSGPPENPVLRLDASRARKVLGWRPQWRFEKAIVQTLAWYRGATSSTRAKEFTRDQLAAYAADLT